MNPNAPNLPENYRSLLFADQSLSDLQITLKGDPKSPDDWLALFRNAYEASRKGDGSAARDSLKRVLNIPDAESRMLLWAWNGLRELGEAPDLQDEKMIQGLVLEIPANGAIDTMAVYRDGRARYFNGKTGLRGGFIWEAPGQDPNLHALIAAVIQSAASYGSLNAKRVPRHLPANPQVYRITILTFSGLYVIETPSSKDIAPILEAGAKLLDAFTTKVKQNPTGAPKALLNDGTREAKASRVLALLCVVAGLLVSAFFVNVYLTHAAYDSRLLLLPPALIIYGVAGLFDPGILVIGAGYLKGKTRVISLTLLVVVFAAWLGLGTIFNNNFLTVHPSQGITVLNDDQFNAFATKFAPQLAAWRVSATDQPQTLSATDAGLVGGNILSVTFGRCSAEGFYVFLFTRKITDQNDMQTPNVFNFSTDGDHFTSYTEGCAPKGWLVLRKAKLGNGWWESVAMQ